MSDPNTELNAESFWRTVRGCSANALRSGALQPISTRASVVEDRGVAFVVRISDNLLRKQSTPPTYQHPGARNPFLPPDAELTVGSLSPHHAAVLNKFNVLRDHVLVVTRGFVHQESPLTVDDFTAVAAGLKNGAGLAFYNAGKTAGASQPHKHFQLVPLPLGFGVDVPTAVLFEGAAGGIDTIKQLRFRHAFARLEVEPGAPRAFGRACHAVYRDALSDLGVVESFDGSEATRLPPYNLIVTDRWLFLAPRSREHFRDISVNGLGYAGSLFVSTPEKLEYVKSEGPMRVLENVSMPAS